MEFFRWLLEELRKAACESFDAVPQYFWAPIKEKQLVSVDYLKITEDKLSKAESKLQTQG